MEPFVELVADPCEMKLVVDLEDHAMTLEEVVDLVDLSCEEANELLERACHREIVNKDTNGDVTLYSPADFYLRLDILSSYEGGAWTSLPAWRRKAVSEWQMAEWIQRWTPELEQIVADPDAYVPMKNRDILLLEEALELVDAAEYICALPCPCITTLLPGSPVVEGSVRLGERARITLEKGQGRSLSREEAKAHLVALDRAGLVHTGPRAWRQHDPQLEWVSHGNCHPSYSFPIRAGLRLGLAKQYPRAHHLASFDWEACTHCGLCIGRCPFGAISRNDTPYRVHGVRQKQIEFDAADCWGCGLCANTCPEDAITMDSLQ
jgi:ferredoxin